MEFGMKFTLHRDLTTNHNPNDTVKSQLSLHSLSSLPPHLPPPPTLLTYLLETSLTLLHFFFSAEIHHWLLSLLNEKKKFVPQRTVVQISSGSRVDVL